MKQYIVKDFLRICLCALVLASSLLAQGSKQEKNKTDKVAENAVDLDPPAEIKYESQPNDGKGIDSIKQELAEEERKNEKDYYVNPKSYGTTRILVPQAYVKTLSQTGISSLKNLDWIEAGLDYRTRYEHRENDLRRPDAGVDRPLLLRTRGYFGIKEILDPIRFAVEIEDAQRVNGKYEVDNRDFNRAEPINAYGELFFKNGVGINRPLSVRYGIMSFEFLDRRLIGLNEWRNTTNTFQGAKISLGKDQNNWSVDFLALKPLERLTNELDKPVRNQLFGGVIGHIRHWSKIITIEPFYLGLKQSKLDQSKFNETKLAFETNNRIGREIHTVGVRFYNVYMSGFDYDISAMTQFGVNDTDKQQRHEAVAYTFESGYSFQHPWKPRAGFFFGYVSGDKNPNDNTNQRFERLYGFARPWSSNDYIQMENLKSPKIVVEFEPLRGVKVDTAVVWFYLASAKDRWSGVGNLRDQTGQSGEYMGFEYNFRARYDLNSRVKANIGYAYFKPGDFTINTTGREMNSHFGYLELMYSLF